MNNKILIVSIIAVVILVLVSFTGVVGYQTKSSTIARASPLFSIRSKRAIDEESKDLTCDYVGKDKGIDILIPKRDYRTASFQKFIDIISKMDDKTFKVYLNLIIIQMQNNDKYDDVNINELITAINQLRDNPDRISLNVYKNGNITWRYEFYPTLCWFPFCFPFGIITAIYVIIQIIYFYMFVMTADFCYTLVHHNPTIYCGKSDF